jgi:hypothetical protein
MYLPKQFHHTDPLFAQRSLREHPLAYVESLRYEGSPVFITYPSEAYAAMLAAIEAGTAYAIGLTCWKKDIGQVPVNLFQG